MKRKILVTVLCASMAMAFSGCGDDEQAVSQDWVTNSDAVATVATTEANNVVETQPQEVQTEAATVAAQQESGDVEIVKEYIYQDYSAYQFLIVKNNSSETVDISASSLAYDKDGNLLGASDESVTAVGAGCTTILAIYFDVSGDIASCDTDLTVSETNSYYQSAIQNLEVKQTDIDSGAVFQITNNGTEVVDTTYFYALFIKNGKVVDYDWTGIYDLESGKTSSEQLDSDEKFDTIEYYLQGYSYN